MVTPGVRRGWPIAIMCFGPRGRLYPGMQSQGEGALFRTQSCHLVHHPPGPNPPNPPGPGLFHSVQIHLSAWSSIIFLKNNHH
ncbi:hypothetical protein DICA3_E07426 [Diutina catenulata]